MRTSSRSPRPAGLAGGDIVNAGVRTNMMRAVKQANTKPEQTVRQILHSLGARFRIANRDLPGSPDIANRSRRWAIFVNGCFWHGHYPCARLKVRRSSRVPVANQEFWRLK